MKTFHIFLKSIKESFCNQKKNQGQSRDVTQTGQTKSLEPSFKIRIFKKKSQRKEHTVCSFSKKYY